MARELAALREERWSDCARGGRWRAEERYTPTWEPVKKRLNLEITTAQYRERLRRQGKPIPPYKDVSHIIAASRGGANHVHNYIICDASLNRSIGNRNDSVFAKRAGLEQTKKAVKASERLGGYKGPSAEELFYANESSEEE